MIRDLPCKLDEGQNSALTCEKCPVDGASNGCVYIQIDLGRTSVLSDRRRYWLICATGITGRFGDFSRSRTHGDGWSRRRISGSTWCARRTASIEASKVSAASQNACSKEELDNKIRAVRNAEQPPVKDLHDFYEETHKKLGRGIANLWEVINLGEEIEYVY